MTICELCNTIKGRGHDNTKDHLQRMAYTSAQYKCDLCKKGFENTRGLSSHKNSGLHIKNEAQSKIVKLDTIKEVHTVYTPEAKPDETFLNVYKKYIITTEEYKNPDIREYIEMYEKDIVNKLNSETSFIKYKLQILVKFETESGQPMYFNISSFYRPKFNKISEIHSNVIESLEDEFERVSDEGESAKIFVSFEKLVLHTNKIKGFAGCSYKQ